MVIMKKVRETKRDGSGLHAPARFLVGLLMSVAAVPAFAQGAAPMPPQSAQPVPDALELSKLIWSTMASIDHANRSGNYSVLRDLSAPGFQVNNDATRLGEIFSTIRNQNIDLSNTLLLAPSYTGAPQLVAPDVMRVRGGFGLRPIAIAFDLYFQWSSGRWKLYGVSIVPVSLATMQPAPAGAPAQAPGRRQ